MSIDDAISLLSNYLSHLEIPVQCPSDGNSEYALSPVGSDETLSNSSNNSRKAFGSSNNKFSKGGGGYGAAVFNNYDQVPESEQY